MTFPELLDRCGIEYVSEGHRHCSSGWINFDCPFCGESGSYRMGYNLERGFVYCWVCGYHWIGKIIQEITGLSGRAAKQLLEDMDVPLLNDDIKPVGKLVLPKHLSSLKSVHRDYLQTMRGLNPTRLEKLWGIQGIGLSTEPGMSWRVFIPVHYKGRVVSWTTRSVCDDDNARRYRVASKEQEEIPLKSLLYGEDFAGSTIIIVEGPLDVWKIGPGAVATSGLGYTREQLLRISKYARRYVCFDSETKAQEIARDLVANLKVMPGETFNVVLDAKDACEASSKEIRSLRKLLR